MVELWLWDPIPTKFQPSLILPQDFRVHLKTHSNNEDTVFRSKAVGEPPLMLANSVWLAIKDAVSYFAKNKRITLNAPATPVEVFNAIQIVQQN